MGTNIFRAVNSTLIYLERGDEYLMLHRTKRKNDLNHDKWIDVGGKFEDSESPEDCALRETREETGLTLTRWRYRGLVTFVSDRYETEYMHLFTADGWTGTPKECDEGELAWIKKSELLKLSFGRATRSSCGCSTRTSRFSRSSSSTRATRSYSRSLTEHRWR